MRLSAWLRPPPLRACRVAMEVRGGALLDSPVDFRAFLDDFLGLFYSLVSNFWRFCLSGIGVNTTLEHKPPIPDPATIDFH